MTRPQNGKVPASALATVQTGTYRGRAYSIKLERATAAAYKKAEADGHLTIEPPLGGDRTLTDQEHLKADPAEYGSNLKPAQIGAAGNSTHGWGDCVDIATNNAWFAAHCHEYGFVRESPAGETNHYRYLHPTWAQTSTASVGSIKTLLAPTRPEEPMLFFNTFDAPAGSKKKVQKWYTFDGHTVVPVPDGDEASFKLALGSSKRVTEVTIARLAAQGARHTAAK